MLGLGSRCGRVQSRPGAGWGLVVEWKLDVHRGPSACGALDDDRAAQRIDTVFQADEAGTSARVSPAGAVVAYGKAQHSVDRRHVDMDDRCAVSGNGRCD